MIIITDMIPLLVIIFIILILIRGVYLIKNNMSVNITKELINLFFILYIVSLCYIVTYKDINPDYVTSNFHLFKEITRYKLFSKMFFIQIVLNILMFIPFGLFIKYYLNNLYLHILRTFIISFFIELIQFKIGRAFDVDDILLNSIGSILGYFSIKYIEK